MPRLLLLCEYPTLLGGERSMFSTFPAVARAGFEILVAAPPQGPLANELRTQGIPHICWQTHDVAGRRRSLNRLREDLGKIIHEHRPELLHANCLSMARVSGVVAAECRTRGIGHLRDMIKVSAQAMVDLCQHTGLIAVSAATRDFHIAQGLDAERCIVLHNGVDLDQWRPKPPTGYLHHELNLSREVQFIATIGQLGQRKGTDIALAAAERIAAQHPRAHWLIVGQRTSNKPESREFEVRLHRLAEVPSLAGRVHFLGARSDVPQLLNECTLLVHAARQEPLGRVLLEAAASGVSIVATDVGGTPEIFPDMSDASGADLVPPDRPEAIAEASLRLLQDSNRRKTVAIAARRRAEMAFDAGIASTRLVAHYQRTLEQQMR